MGELETIRVFLGVADHGGFAEAARHLGLTPAAATRSVAALEDRLGVQLFVRTTRKVALTAAGAAYAEKVRPLAEGLAQAAEDLLVQQGRAAGRLRINAPLSLGVRMLPEVLAQFRILYPEVTLSVSLTDRFVDILAEEFDLAIRISGPPSDKSTIWRKICPVPRLLVASPAYLAARGTPGTPEALEAHTCLGYDPETNEEFWDLRRGRDRHRIRAGTSIVANNGDLLAGLAAGGEGIALLPAFITAGDIAASRLVQVLEGWEPPPLWLTLYYPPYDRLPMRVATFSDFFETRARAAAGFA